MFFKDLPLYQEELFKPCCLIWIAIFFYLHLQQILLILRCAARHMFPQQPLQARNGTPTWHHTLCEKSQPRPPTIGSKNPYSSDYLENSRSSSGYLSPRLCCFTRDWNASQSIEAPQQEILNASLWKFKDETVFEVDREGQSLHSTSLCFQACRLESHSVHPVTVSTYTGV